MVWYRLYLSLLQEIITGTVTGIIDQWWGLLCLGWMNIVVPLTGVILGLIHEEMVPLPIVILTVAGMIKIAEITGIPETLLYLNQGCLLEDYWGTHLLTLLLLWAINPLDHLLTPWVFLVRFSSLYQLSWFKIKNKLMFFFFFHFRVLLLSASNNGTVYGYALLHAQPSSYNLSCCWISSLQ